MRKRVLGCVAVCVVAACGGPGGGGGPNRGNETDSYYSDIKGYGVPVGAESVLLGHWPSWLHEKQLVSACASGEAFYADRCWQHLVIDADAGRVTVVASNADEEHLALGEVIPAVLGSMVLSDSGVGSCPPAMDGWSCAWPHHSGTGYVQMDGPWLPGQGYSPQAVWDVPVGTSDHGRPTTRSPWVIGTEIGLRAGVVSGFLVKTTQLYGFAATTPTPLWNEFTIVHNWSYSGTLKVNSVQLTLPVRLADIVTATGLSIHTASDGSHYIDDAAHKVRFVCQKDVIDARLTWGGAGVGLSESDLVTSVEMQTTGMSLP